MQRLGRVGLLGWRFTSTTWPIVLFCVLQGYWYLRFAKIATIPPVVTFAGPGDVNSDGLTLGTGVILTTTRGDGEGKEKREQQ